MGNFKIVAVDLDGTVLDSSKSISKENIEAFRLCKQNGIHVIPVTGRPTSGLYKEYIDAIGCRYSINTNGAVAVDLVNKNELLTHTLSTAVTENILDVLDYYDCYYSLFYKGLGYLANDKYNYELNRYIGTPMHKYINVTRRSVDKQRDFIRSIDHCDNVYVTAKTTKIRDEICKNIEQIKGIFFTCSDIDDVEIGGNCSKGKTLLELAQLLRVKKDQILAIGDSGNDISMLEIAGLGVAMGNSALNVKQSADYISKSCEENGVAYAIHKFCL